MLNPEFHWLRQIATIFRQFQWHFRGAFLSARAKAKKMIRKSIAKDLVQVWLMVQKNLSVKLATKLFLKVEFCVQASFTDGSQSQKFPTSSVGILVLALAFFL